MSSPSADFDALWRAHHQAVHAYALRRTDGASAQDVTAETFLVAWRRRRDRPPDDPRAWLIGVARHVLANQQRTTRRQDALVDVLAARSARSRPAHADVDRELLHALARLREDDREALLLTAWDGLTGAQAARVLGVSTSAFWVRAHRARARLRAELSPSTAPQEAAQR